MLAVFERTREIGIAPHQRPDRAARRGHESQVGYEVPMIRILRRPRGVLEPLVRLDCRLFARVAGTSTPWLDRGLPMLSRSANHSALWMAIGVGLGAAGGRRGQRAAVRGLASVGVTSLVVNQGVKRVVRRPRPSLRNVPAVRRVRVAPLTTSFPSGHAASAAAFAAGAAIELAPAGPPLGVLAGAVGGSRVYVGAHYPLDVLVGAGMGAGIAWLTRRVWSTLPARADDAPPSRGSSRPAAEPGRRRCRRGREPELRLRVARRSRRDAPGAATACPRHPSR